MMFRAVMIPVVIMAAVAKATEKRDLRQWLMGRPALSWALSCAMILVIVLFGAYGIGYDASQFIYTQF
jgi:hypothetical protein